MSKKSNFVRDTKLIDEKIAINTDRVQGEMLEAAFLPYFVHPDSMELTVVLKRSLAPGAYVRTGRKMSLSVLTTVLPEDEPVTIEQAFESLPLNGAKLQNAIPFGSVMPNIEKSNLAYEMVLVQIEPIELLDEERGIVYQEKGQYEIGVVGFTEILGAIQENLIQDLKTRMMLSELYILALEEANNENDPNNMMSGNREVIGGGSNLPDGFGDQTDTVRTGDLDDDFIAQNSQMDFGAIYSKATSNAGFTTVENK